MIRVRFAPSPTGDLHVGGLRTALYNYLFARRHRGTFVLRIEDTDRERYVPGASDKLLETLQLCGLQPDEGPGIGGDFGPYIQSERLDLYRRAAQRLIEKGRAYPCFCSKERLDELRTAQRARGADPRYDRRCRNIPPDEARARMLNEPYVIRLAVPLVGDIQHHDLVWDDISFPLKDVDDQVLVKSDGFPTYHLANVVDDVEMKISHVIRGEEWLISIPKHLLLYDFLGYQAPAFAHLPLILNRQRHKLSKREGGGSVADWLQKGIPPSALINYIALLGWHAADDREIFSLKELIAVFSLDRINKSGAVFDPAKLEWVSGEHIKRMEETALLKQCRRFLEGTEFSRLPDDHLLPLLTAVRHKLHTLADLPPMLVPFAAQQPPADAEALAWLRGDTGRMVLPVIWERWRDAADPSPENLLSIVKQVGKDTRIKGKDLWMPLRAALTGRTAGPELKVLLSHLGASEAIARVSAALSL